MPTFTITVTITVTIIITITVTITATIIITVNVVPKLNHCHSIEYKSSQEYDPYTTMLAKKRD